mgnify:CR=1 FL=1
MKKFYRFRMSLFAMMVCLLTPFLSATAYTITTPFQMNDNVSSVTDRQAAYATSSYNVVESLGKPKMTIACISDIHTQYEKTSTNFQIRESFQKAVTAINKDEDIDLMILGGDCNNSSNTGIDKKVWEYAVSLLKTKAQSAFQSGRTDKPILLVDGNHDYESAHSGDSYNSGDYYDAILKSTIGELSSEDTFYEKTNNGKYNLLAAFHYVINGFDFVCLNTGKYLYDNSSNYNYSIESAQWVVNKLDAIDPDGTKTVFFVTHIPFNDSNRISGATSYSGAKGMHDDYGSETALKKGLARHPNTIMLYGHDHGGNDAYSKSLTSERVTRYNANGSKLSGATDATHVNGIYLTSGDNTEPESSATIPDGQFYIQSVENNKYMAQSTVSGDDANSLVLADTPSLLFTTANHATSGALAVKVANSNKYLYSGGEHTFSVAETSNPTYIYKKVNNTWTKVSAPTLNEQYVIAIKGKSDNNYYAIVNTNKQQSNNKYPRLDYTQVTLSGDKNTLTFNTTPANMNSVLWTFVTETSQPETPGTGSTDGTDYFFSEFMGSMRFYSNRFQTDKDNYTNERVLVQGLMIYVYDDRIVFTRREFVTDGSLGPDWVVPLKANVRPYGYKVRADAEPAPAFAENAKVSISEEYEGKNRGGATCRQVKVTFPPALPSAKGRSRAFSYEVRVLQTMGDLVRFPCLARRVLSKGVNRPEALEPKEVELVLNAGEIQHECKLEFEVTALGCFGRRSKPIMSEPTKLKGLVVKW